MPKGEAASTAGAESSAKGGGGFKYGSPKQTKKPTKRTMRRGGR